MSKNIGKRKPLIERHGYRSRKQNDRQDPTYGSWEMMKRRCNNPNYINYKNYGGKGVTVCARWNDFLNFLEDMGDRPTYTDASGATRLMTLDRIDPEGNYEPGNVRWATASEQAKNKRKKVKV